MKRDKPIRVLVVEDSPTVRELLVSILASAPGFQVVGQAGNGAEAVAEACRLEPDLITMDVHMPIMDGLDATREIMREQPTPIVIVSSSISRADTDAALDATRAGALMVLPKPGPPGSPGFETRRDELVAMARAMAGVRVVRRWGAQTRAGRPSRDGSRSMNGQGPVRAIAIGTSTGGPAALQKILEDLPPLQVPVLVVQHMAHGFIRGLAAWLADTTGKTVRIAEAGETLVGGAVYIAPDDRHFGVTTTGRAQLSDASPTNGFRPSADFLFHSCSLAYGDGLVGVILTGMGQDGVAGLCAAHVAGAYVIAQDEATSVVFGMAQVAIQAGAVDEVLPVDQIGKRLGALAQGATP